MRYKLVIEYDGTAFVGWQAQKACLPSQKGVQTVIEEAIARLCRGRPVRLHAAGRTDTGVHACGQVAHVDIEHPVEASVLRRAVNALVKPYPVSIVSAEVVDPSFHARFGACMRYYRYLIINRPAPAPLQRARAWVVHYDLDAVSMHEAGQHLVGFHDFTTFRAAACQAHSPLRTLTSLKVSQEGETITIDVSAPSFLHHQIRSIVGCLKKVGEGSWAPSAMEHILQERNRKLCAPLAPPHGLYFMRVDY